jgi:hypothetical protein
MLLTQMSTLFDRLDDKAKHTLLQILVNRIIVDPDGRIVDYQLNRPFGYLRKLVNDPTIELNGQSGSKQVPFGVLSQNTRVQPDDVGLFLSELRFESQVQKSKVEELLNLPGIHGAN